MSEYLYVSMAPSGRPCNCEDFDCTTMRQIDTHIKQWSELIQLLQEHPHMRVFRCELRESE